VPFNKKIHMEDKDFSKDKDLFWYLQQGVVLTKKQFK
jgi:hypothetical protein